MCPPVAVNSQRKVLTFPEPRACRICAAEFFVPNGNDVCPRCIRQRSTPLPPKKDLGFVAGLWNAFLILLVLGGIFAISWLACLQAWKWAQR